MKQLWLSVLLTDTSAATGHARIRTHVLTTPEIEPDALDRPATTLHDIVSIDHANLARIRTFLGPLWSHMVPQTLLNLFTSEAV